MSSLTIPNGLACRKDVGNVHSHLQHQMYMAPKRHRQPSWHLSILEPIASCTYFSPLSGNCNNFLVVTFNTDPFDNLPHDKWLGFPAMQLGTKL